LPLLLTNLVKAIRSTGLVAAVVSGGAVVAVVDDMTGRAVVLVRCVAVTGAADTASTVVVLPPLHDDEYAPAKHSTHHDGRHREANRHLHALTRYSLS
jgi:hypothetical protein